MSSLIASRIVSGKEMGNLLKVEYQAGVDSREQPVYTINEAAYYIGMSSQTLSTWFFGRSFPTKSGPQFWEPVFTPADPGLRLLSFYNLAEAHVLAASRYDHKVPFFAVRDAIRNVVAANPQWESHPLLSEDFFTNGKFLFAKKIKEFVNVSSEQLPMEIIDSFLVRVLRDDNGPFKIFPLRKGETNDKVISIVAGVSASRPIVDGVGIPVMAIYRRYQAGEAQKFIADDFEIDLARVRRAIEYAEHRTAA
jgi:uncharacterized protein (DUF433 family)